MKRRLSIIGILGLLLGLTVIISGCTLFEGEVVSKGRRLFMYYCADCHGESGMGDGYNAENLDPEPRDLTDSEDKYLTGFTNEELFETLNRDLNTPINGRFIPVTMPTFKYTLSESKMWSIVAYVRTLHPNDAPRIEITPEMKRKRPRFARIRDVDLDPNTLTDDKRVESGKRLYEETYGCRTCHSIGGEGGRIGPPLDRAGFMSNADWLYRWVKNPQAINPRTKMTNLGLKDEDALSVVAYLNTLRAPAAVAGDQPQP
jgi:mono/diheme cytochrome c family protein